MRVQKFDANTVGRDFVVGDMHGFLDLFLAELDRLNFDPSCDRVFSVGDLIDRGPNSMGCLRLLKQPWFHAVRGNHEQMLLDYCFPHVLSEHASDVNAKTFLQHGGAWVLMLDAAEKDEFWYELLPLVQATPHLMCVGHGENRFHVVHAELLTGAPEFSIKCVTSPPLSDCAATARVLTDADLDDENGAALGAVSEAMLWGRRLFKASDQSTAKALETPLGTLKVSRKPWRENLSLTYVGHTPVRHMVLHESHLFIDRGAFLRKPDSCLLVACHQDMVDALVGI